MLRPFAAAAAALAVAASAGPARAAAPEALARASASGIPTPMPYPGPPAPPAGGWTSRAVGKPWAGMLRGGVQLPEAGPDHATWDFVRKAVPNRGWRRWGTDRLVTTLLQVAQGVHVAHPDVLLLVGDLSRPRGGVFDERFGGLGHLSHRNGLDADVAWPRLDRRLRAPRTWRDVDQALAQELVDRFLAAGAEKVFVGPKLRRVRGPKGKVVVLAHHDDHLHVRLPRAPAR